MENLWKIILVFQLISLLFKFIEANSGRNLQDNCIQIPSFKTTENGEPICDFLRGNKETRDRVVFVSDESSISRPAVELMRVINELCSFQMMNFDSKTVLKLGMRWMETIDTLILHPSLCEESIANSKVRELIRLFRGQTFVFVVEKLNRSHMIGIDLDGNSSETMRICSSTCSGEPASTKSSLTIAARKFETFTIADNASTINRGIEIMFIESIARKMNIQLDHNIGSSSNKG